LAYRGGIPLALVITLAWILTPAVDWLQKMRLSRALAVILVLIITIEAAGGPAG
jgi:predicted PurR-regulated permease PerM